MLSFKTREAYFCNLKLFLLFLTVYGHLLEPLLSFNLHARFIYELIYSFHMPLFVFLSGLFIKSQKQCINQMKTAFKSYLLWQGIYVLISAVFIGQKLSASLFLIPYWHLWYLLSLGFWCSAAWLYFSLSRKWQLLKHPLFKMILIFVSLSFSCISGALPLGRTLSLSRTVVFFPYFLLGLFCPVDFCFKKLRKYWVFLLPSGLGLFVFIKNAVPVSFWYHASSVGFPGGWTLRILAYLCALCLGAATLAMIPRKRFFCTKAGADTMMIYILHAPLVVIARKFYFLSPFYEIAAPFLSLLFIFGIYAAFAWKGSLYSFKGGDGHSGVSRRI